uniref:VLIG-type G domain-containing protein n=1 Tax=Amazona collaria TaxID=241587 RepID=A0A8B9FDR1_9PSIT
MDFIRFHGLVYIQVPKVVPNKILPHSGPRVPTLTVAASAFQDLGGVVRACEHACKHGFLVDEDIDACVTAKEKAKVLVKLLKEEKLLEIKSQLLPLQGKLWYMWCKKDKELTRLQEKGNQSIEHHRSQTELEKSAIRRKQLEQAFPLNQLMKSLLKNIDALSNEINDSSIGLEHILREVGQIYEALELMNSKDECFVKLPEIAADLMVSGYPVELMDGDASYIPLRWVSAIFDRLINKIGDKRVFVLSVLGIQSTGKSALLNAMFGLQFNVSAGRCTWGAFMQLIKVDEKLQQDLGFSYMLVVDTEGLRAIEMANKHSLNHDNELATFVIGIGNMTLINIFGENPSEMQDVLQIAVQAFLRMKQVKLSPSCLFVHQNVGDITAKEQNMEARRCLQEKLDEMTVPRESLENLVQKTSDDIMKDMEKYFTEEKDHEILVQWRVGTELKLKELKESLLRETRKKCENLIELKKNQ